MSMLQSVLRLGGIIGHAHCRRRLPFAGFLPSSTPEAAEAGCWSEPRRRQRAWISCLNCFISSGPEINGGAAAMAPKESPTMRLVLGFFLRTTAAARKTRPQRRRRAANEAVEAAMLKRLRTGRGGAGASGEAGTINSVWQAGTIDLEAGVFRGRLDVLLAIGTGKLEFTHNWNMARMLRHSKRFVTKVFAVF
jgi:hypothetical protein